MYVIKYTKSPRGYYVGYIKGKDDRLHFFAGETESKLYARGRKSAYEHYRATTDEVFIEPKPMNQDEFPSHLIDYKWRTVWWTGIRVDGRPAAPMSWDRRSKMRRKFVELDKDKDVESKDSKRDESFEFHFVKRVDDKIIVYGCKKIAEYNAEPSSALACVAPFVPAE